MTREFKQHDEPRRARARHECPDPDCDADFGDLQALIEHGGTEHGFRAFQHSAD